MENKLLSFFQKLKIKIVFFVFLAFFSVFIFKKAIEIQKSILVVFYPPFSFGKDFTSQNLRKRGSEPFVTKAEDFKPPDFEYRLICSSSFEKKSLYASFHIKDNNSLPIIYVITPTYQRPEMAAELTRISQTLLLVQNVHWILGEDSYNCSQYITDFLNYLGIPYVYMISPLPVLYKANEARPRGIAGRLAALDWIRGNGSSDGVIYFLDDDNTVSIRLFDEMRYTKKVSMWPVGLVGYLPFTSPIIQEGKVTGFFDFWAGARKFQVDMSSFAVNVGYFKNQVNVTMPYDIGYGEDGFLRSLGIELSEIEAKADLCTKILVWHTRTVPMKKKLVSLAFPRESTNNIAFLTRKFNEGVIL
ncbi:UNVERIFIED_CONTAM: hypothetical protein RMT77_005419 [Armadillidium vulgare]